MRPDFLSLTIQDLEALSNKGTVNRAVKDLESGMQAEWIEYADGNIEAKWEDSIRCLCPASAPVQEFQCSCDATGICRHIIRTIVAYQRRTKVEPLKSSWNPGDISDDELSSFLSPASIAQAKALFHNGVVVELDRTAVPTVKIQGHGTVQFPVANDIRYARADRKGLQGEQLIAIAVWAFRLTEEKKGLVSTRQEKIEVPPDILTSAEAIFEEIVWYGLQSISGHIREKLLRLEKQCEAAKLFCPADVISEISEEYAKYTMRDALFQPGRLTDLIGEWFLRMDALTGNQSAVPTLVVAGEKKAHTGELVTRSLFGLGSRVRVMQKGLVIISYFLDPKSEQILTSEKWLDIPAEEPFSKVGNTSAYKGVSYVDFAKNSVVSSSIKRNASGRLEFSTKVAINPQNFQFENEKLVVDDYSEMIQRLAGDHPKHFGARLDIRNFFIFEVKSLDQMYFDSIHQTLCLEVKDRNGVIAKAILPYYSRALEGFENLESELADAALRYVFAKATLKAGTLVLSPVSLIVDRDGQRSMIQPYLDSKRRTTTSSLIFPQRDDQPLMSDPLTECLTDIKTTIQEICLIGFQQFDSKTRLGELIQRTDRLGLKKISALLGSVLESLQFSKSPGPFFTLIAWVALIDELDLGDDV